jgi:hypothetical protein
MEFPSDFRCVVSDTVTQKAISQCNQVIKIVTTAISRTYMTRGRAKDVRPGMRDVGDNYGHDRDCRGLGRRAAGVRAGGT